MSNVLLYAIGFSALIVLETLYFRVADHFNIIDKPNQRSSHTVPTIRGGGVIFLLAVLFWFLSKDFQMPWFVTGVILIGAVSFLDDLGEQPARIRLVVHFAAFLLLGLQAGVLSLPYWIIILFLVLGVGVINAFNFMDGINGITGIYSFVVLCSLLFLNVQFQFVDGSLIVLMLLATGVFLYFNFRSKARCFAGDVGSVTIAFVIFFMIVKLILATGEYNWILLLLVYGVDSVVTIIYRLSRRENIFKAHRTHLYQYLCNELKASHRSVSAWYGLAQLAINLLLWYGLQFNWWVGPVIAVFVGTLYLLIREFVIRKINVPGWCGRIYSMR